MLVFAQRVYATGMLGFLVRAAWRMLVLAGLIYGTFFVPLGGRTLYAHGSRIARTAEAQELWSSIVTLVQDVHRGLTETDASSATTSAERGRADL